MHFQTVSSMLNQDSKLESEDCINEKLMNTHVTNLIKDDNTDLEQQNLNKIETNKVPKEMIEENISTESKFFSDNSSSGTNLKQTDNNDDKSQNSKKLDNDNQIQISSLIQLCHHEQNNNSNKGSFIGNHSQKFNQKFHNNINNNHNSKNINFSNNRIANIQQSKALNLHKLWPHSLKQQSSTSNQMKQDEKILLIKQGETSNESTENQKNEEESSSDNKKHETKTPLCIINELVRFNKIKHEYVLLDEIGPAHKKTFFILLKLGIDTDKEEIYKASGSSIKKTQHIAAELALKNTKFQMPVKRDKTLNHALENNVSNKLINNESSELKAKKRTTNKTANPPTVKLNTLAMKLGLVANYTHHISNHLNDNDYTNLSSIGFNNMNKNYQPLYAHQGLNYANNYTNFKYPVNHVFPGNVAAPDYSHQYNKDRLNNFMNDSIAQRNRNNNSRNLFNDNAMRQQNYFPVQKMQQLKQIINVKLSFANKEFKGKGITLQHAKHDAAEKALEYFTDPEHFLEAKSISNSSQNNNVKAYRPPQFYQQQKLDLQENHENNNVDEKSDKDSKVENQSDTVDTTKANNSEDISLLKTDKSEVKSEVQLVHEYAFFLKKNIDFSIVQESGASHLKKFVTKCSITNKVPIQNATTDTSSLENPLTTSDQTENSQPNEQASLTLETTGEGNSKRLSKKNAASKMLEILKEKFEPLFLISSKNEEKKTKSNSTETKDVEDTQNSSKQETKTNQKKNRKSKAKNIIKIKKTSPEYGKGTINAISRLMQIQQAKKEQDPIFEFIEANPDKIKKRQQEFVIHCTIESSAEAAKTVKTEGKGTTKKAAKQKAAEEMLIKLGYQVVNPILKPSLKASIDSSSEKKEIKCSASLEKLNEKNEKKVKFLDAVINSDNLTTSTNTEKNVIEPIQNKSIQTKSQKPNELLKAHQNKQQKLRNIQQAIANNQLNNTNHNLDSKTFNIVFKIAQELLESVQKSNNEDSSNELPKEFHSPSAEQYLKDNAKQIPSNNKGETLEEKTQFNLLNGGTQTVNYKKMLDYLADTIGFKVNCQSLLGRDSTVNSYVNLSILPETEKPLNGNGSTYIESSNSACLNALRYLSSKYVSSSSSSSKIKPQQEISEAIDKSE